MEEEREVESYRDKWEREYRRRMRRRKVMIARTVTAVFALLLLVFLGLGIRSLVRHIGAGRGEDNKAVAAGNTKKKADKSQSYDTVYVPEGYEDYFEQLIELQKEYEDVDAVIRNISDYPKEYLDMLLDNVETLDYVKDYPEHKYDTKAGKITEDITVGEIPLFNQWDKRWGYLSYGNSKLAWNGCGPTALSMVVVGLTGDTSVTPKAVAEYSEKNGYYDPDVGTVWSLMSQGAAGFGLTITNIPLVADSIIRELENGKPVICSMMPGDFTDYGHFIVLTGIDEDGKIRVNDPNSIARSEMKWDIDRIVSQIKGLWSYSAN